MNVLKLSLEVVDAGKIKELDGLEFSSCVFVNIEVDGENLLSQPEFLGTVVYFDEVERSLSASGKYLIFTCACGIAEDAGWSEIEVLHQQGIINWVFLCGTNFHFSFDVVEYRAEVEKCRHEINNRNLALTLEPVSVTFPT